MKLERKSELFLGRERVGSCNSMEKRVSISMSLSRENMMPEATEFRRKSKQVEDLRVWADWHGKIIEITRSEIIKEETGFWFLGLEITEAHSDAGAGRALVCHACHGIYCL